MCVYHPPHKGAYLQTHTHSHLHGAFAYILKLEGLKAVHHFCRDTFGHVYLMWFVRCFFAFSFYNNQLLQTKYLNHGLRKNGLDLIPFQIIILCFISTLPEQISLL